MLLPLVASYEDGERRCGSTYWTWVLDATAVPVELDDVDITQYCLALPWLNGDGTPKAAAVHGGVQYCVRTNERQEIGDGLLIAQRQTEP
jgi:hypothetical protein